MGDIVPKKAEFNIDEFEKIEKPKAADTEDVSAKYEALVKSGATAISSDMLFDEQAQAKKQ